MIFLKFEIESNYHYTKIRTPNQIGCFSYPVLCKFEFWLGTTTKNFLVQSVDSFFLTSVFMNYPYICCRGKENTKTKLSACVILVF